jgi:hypothetical protein
MNEQDTTLAVCYARFRPPDSYTAHHAEPGADKTLCGRWTGPALPEGWPAWKRMVTCEACRGRSHPRRKAPTEQKAPEPAETVTACAEEALTGPPLVYLVAEAGTRLLRVYMPWNELLYSAIKTVPGGMWCKPDRCWLIPEILAPVVYSRFASIGATVVTAYDPERYCVACAGRLDDPRGRNE